MSLFSIANDLYQKSNIKAYSALILTPIISWPARIISIYSLCRQVRRHFFDTAFKPCSS